MNVKSISRVTAVAVVLVTGVAACSTPYGWVAYPEASALELLTAEEWRTDVEYLRAELPERNPHFREDPAMAAEFDAEAETLLASIDAGTTPAEAITGISRLLALIGEGHTSLNTYPTSYFSVIAAWFADGFFVAGADREHADIVGSRITGIRDATGSDLSLADLEPILNTVVAADHENGYRPAHGQVLVDPYLMRGLGLASESGLTYLLDQEGTPMARTVGEKAGTELDIVRASDNAPNVPLAARSADANWYTRTGTAERTIYLSYGECRSDAMGLFQGLVGELKRTRVERLIVDLRRNSGGTSVPGSWFAAQLSGIQGLNREGGIFVLIGPATFSSGMMLAVDLMEKTDAIFAGEPLAESPNSWGEVKRFPLPNSGLMVGHSTKFFTYGRNKDLRLDEDGNLIPDDGFYIERSFAEYENGVDPVVEAALAYGR